MVQIKIDTFCIHMFYIKLYFRYEQLANNELDLPEMVTDQHRK